MTCFCVAIAVMSTSTSFVDAALHVTTGVVVGTTEQQGGGVADHRGEREHNAALAAASASVPVSTPSASTSNKRRLTTAIDSTSTLRTAVGAWCSDPTSAEDTYGHISIWDTSAVTEGGLYSLFYTYCSTKSTFNDDISGWDMSNVEGSALQVFRGCTSFNQDLSKWNVSRITSLEGAFYGATAFNSNISTWDVSRVTSFVYMFYGATSFNQDLPWDTSSGTSFYGMFLVSFD